MKRLRSYSRNLADYRLVMDLLPLLASLRFTDTLVTPLSHVQVRNRVSHSVFPRCFQPRWVVFFGCTHVHIHDAQQCLSRGNPCPCAQAAILLGMGLQGKSVERLEAELGLPASQILALYNKSMRKMIAALRSVQEEEAAAELPSETAASEATLRMTPLQEDLADELIEGAAKATQQMREAHMRKQQAKSGLAGYCGRESYSMAALCSPVPPFAGMARRQRRLAEVYNPWH